MRKISGRPLSQAQKAELAALAELPDNAIDTSDAPEMADWSGAKQGMFYRPVKQQLTLRLDADIVAWFKAQADKGYQTQINLALRDHVRRQAPRPHRRRRRDSD